MLASLFQTPQIPSSPVLPVSGRLVCRKPSWCVKAGETQHPRTSSGLGTIIISHKPTFYLCQLHVNLAHSSAKLLFTCCWNVTENNYMLHTGTKQSGCTRVQSGMTISARFAAEIKSRGVELRNVK